jgi:hypothetical protein
MKVDELAKKVRLPHGVKCSFKGSTFVLVPSEKVPKPPLNMGNIKFGYLEWSNPLEVTAGVVGCDWNTIYFNPYRKKELWPETEENIEFTLMHENLHQVIGYLEGGCASGRFDDLFENKAELKKKFCKEISER